MSDLSEAIKKAQAANPLLTLPQGQAAEGLSAQLAAKKKLTAPQLRSSVARQEQLGKKTNASDAAPVNDFLARVYGVLETPLSGLGAAQMDFMRQPTWQISGGGPSAQNFYHLVKQGKLNEAAQRYSTTSLAANKTRAQMGDPGAQYFQRHPSQFGALAFGEEFANPGNLATGEAMRLAGAGAKAGLTAAGRTAARVAGQTGGPAARTLRSLGEVATGNRFGEVRQAAADEAVRRGVHPAQAANEADVISRQLATLPQRSRAISQHITSDVFKGLTKDEQIVLVDRVEGMTPKIKLDPKRLALVDERMRMYRNYRAKLDTLTKASGYLGDRPMWQGQTYFPRAGHTLEPDMGEEGIEEEIASRRGRGGMTLRKETLGVQKHRSYRTRQQAAANATVNPDWSPAATLERHVANRVQNAGIEIGMKRLRNLGLVDAGRQDFIPFSQIGATHTFGSPTLTGSRVYPAVPSLIQDIAPAGANKGTLASMVRMAIEAAHIPNRLAAKLQVSNPVYHPLVNVSQNTGAQLLAGNLDPIQYLKGFLGKQTREASEAGADVPYSEHKPVADYLRPWRDLTAKEKLGRAAVAPIRLGNAITNRALYKNIQPRMAQAAFQGLKGKLGEERAALTTRQILGEPENIPPSLETASQAFMFPHWNAAMVRYWSKMLAEHPALYMAPHSAVNARNLSRGVSPQQSDWGTLIPPIALGKDKRGNESVLPIPGPANKLIGVTDIIGNYVTGQGNAKEALKTGLNMLNPLLNLGGRELITEYGPPGPANSTRLYDKDAPPTTGLPGIATLEALIKRYSPNRGGVSNPLGMVGVNPYSRMSDKRGKWEYKVDQMIRNGFDWNGHFYPGIDSVRKKIAAAKAAGQDYFLWGKKQTKVPIAQGERYADKMFEKLQKLAPEYEGVQP